MSTSESYEGAIFGICNPLLDISAQVPMSMLEKYKITPKSACLADDSHMALFDELVSEYPVEYIAGGAAQNTIRCAQWMLQKPGATTFVGCVGQDKFAEQLRTSARADGVDVDYMEEHRFPTGTCAVLVTDKDRSLVANLGAANHYTIDHLRSEKIWAKVKKARIFYATCFFLTVSPESLITLGEYAEQTGKIFMFNISAAFLITAFFDPLMRVLPLADIIFANETETAAFGEAMHWGSDLKVITRKIAEADSKAHRHAGKTTRRMMITTRGPDPAYVSVAGEECIEFPVPPVPEHEIIDTNGAGDSFVGGFIAYFLLGHPLEVCVAAGHYAAGQCIRQSGSKFVGLPTFTP